MFAAYVYEIVSHYQSLRSCGTLLYVAWHHNLFDVSTLRRSSPTVFAGYLSSWTYIRVFVGALMLSAAARFLAMENCLAASSSVSRYSPSIAGVITLHAHLVCLAVLRKATSVRFCVEVSMSTVRVWRICSLFHRVSGSLQHCVLTPQ